METFLELLKYIIPSIITFGATYFVLQKFLDTEHRKQLLELRQENQKITTPLRLQAYERLVLFLERIAMDKLVLRIHQPGKSATMMKTDLIRTIQQEFDHNLTQQLYTSNTSWETVRRAKEESIKIIDLADAQMKAGATANDLGQKIFEIMTRLDKAPSKIALQILKKEIRQLF